MLEELLEIKQIDENYSVAGQIDAADVADIAQAGFASIICNRPDSEEGAVPHEAIAAAAEKTGLEFRFIPVVSSQMTLEDVEAQAAALDELPKPVLAYCRSGTRCTNLYAAIRQSGG